MMLETVKLAEDRSGAMVVRLYEMHGGSSKVRLVIKLTSACGLDTIYIKAPVHAFLKSELQRPLCSWTNDSH